jgi:anhydro-N-acetylmuramic acid kinase
MVVAGIMSGTSADGVDVALVRVTGAAEATPRLKLLGHAGFPYPKAVRAAVLRAMEGDAVPVAGLARLNWRLGELYADAVAATVAQTGIEPELIGLHGQTIYHQGVAERFLGRATRATWQTGEASVVAERLRVPVVSDFRPADLAAGGQAAPLVPMLDFCMFRHAAKNRILLNLGGIANLTAIPAGGSLDDVLAFDTGPANMLIDAVMARSFGRTFDRGGKVGARGTILDDAVAALLRDPYFAALPPKSCGREQFGASYLARLLKLCGSAPSADIVATATALTARSIRDAYARFCWPHLGQRAPLARATELIVSGGGARNAFLVELLRDGLEPLHVKVSGSAEMGPRGIEPEAKEAAAFALLAWLTWNRRPGNVPAATGASRQAVLGKVSWP